jgi:hypothetical protein
LVDLFGTSETDQWVGNAITLEKTKVEFSGKRVPAIRIADELPGGSGSSDGDIPL